MKHHLIQNQLDFILFEEGRFSPLSWLLREGHLEYNDYQTWKRGATKYLEDHFKTTTSILITALEVANDYASLLKLEASRETYLSIDNRPLQICRLSVHEPIFTTIYEPAHGRIQMDLFYDSADTCALTNLINAIVEGRKLDVPGLMAKLAPLNPDKYIQLNHLLGFEQKLTQTKLSSAEKIELTTDKITPLAFELLGRYTLDYLTPLWHKLSEEVADVHYDADKPQNHLSFTAFKAFQWQQVLSSIEQEKGWILQPPLIFRYAESCFKLNREREGIEYWFRLFIRFSDDAERFIQESCHRLMSTDWHSFAELDPELDSALFPAWMLIKKPALAKGLDSSCTDGNEPMQLIAKLLGNTEGIINETVINLRARLQHISPNLFIHYMRVHLKEEKL